MRTVLAAATLLLASAAGALAQSNPGFVTGQVPTATQWNSYFSAKLDYNSAAPYLSVCGPGVPGTVPTPPGDPTQFLNANCAWGTVSGSGNVSASGSASVGNVPLWTGTFMLSAAGLPVGPTGNSTIVETSPLGLIANSLIANLPLTNLVSLPASTLLCNPTASPAEPTYCVLGTGLSFSGGTLNSSGGVVSVSGTAGQATASPTTGAVIIGLPAVITQAENFTGGLQSGGSNVLVANQTITLSGDTTGSGAASITTTTGRINGVSYGSSPATNTVPVVTSPNTVTYGMVPNAALLNSTFNVSVPSFLTSAGSTALGGTLAITATSESANLFLASPNGSAGAMTPRAIVAADVANLSPTFNVLTVTSCAGCVTWPTSGYLVVSAGAGQPTGIAAVSNECALGVSGSWAASALCSLTNLAQTFTAAKTFANNDLLLLGSSTGTTTLSSANASGTNYTITIPAANDTIDLLGTAQTITAAKSFGAQVTSTVTGVAPFVVASAINVANLNASSLNGATFASPGSIGGTAPATALSVNGSVTMAGLTTGGSINGSLCETTAGLVLFESGVNCYASSGLVNSGTAGQVAYYATSTNAVNGSSALTLTSASVSAMAISLGSDVTGDIYYRNSSGNLARLGIGSSGQGLFVSGGLPAWQTATGNTTSSMTTSYLPKANGISSLINSSVSDNGSLVSTSEPFSALTVNGLTITNNGTNTLNIAAGKTLTDTSGIGANLLLGSTGGGFASYVGYSCTNQFLITLSAAGVGTCAPVTNAYLTAGSFSSITGVGTLTAGATGSGFTIALSTSTVTGTLPFSDIASGTSTGALLIGTGGSLAISGSGTITATAMAVSGLTGTTLPASITASSLTSLGTLTALTSNGAITFPGVANAGGTYCVQISTAGVMSNTGAACGTGSGAVNSVTGTAGQVTTSPTTGAVVVGLPSTITEALTFSAAVNHTGALEITGSSSGYTTLASANTGATNYMLTMPAANDTLADLAGSQAFTNKSYNGLTITTSTGTLTIANGKTLTDTSVQGAVLLLGATGGGFASYGGVTCTSQFLSALSAAGAGTCASVTNAYLTAGTFSNITGVGTLTAGATGSGFTINLTASTVSGALPFSAVGSGTSTAAMIVGTGGTLSATGSGIITATAAPASGLTGATLAAGVTGSSLTSVGTLVSGATGAGFTVNFSTSTFSGTVPFASLASITGSFLGALGSGPNCPLTSSSTVTISAATCAASALDGISVQSLTLASNVTFGCTTGGVVNQWIEFDVTQPSTGGPYVVTLPGTCYDTPGMVQPAAGSWWSSVNSALDAMSCKIVTVGSPDTLTCYKPQQNIGAAGTPAVTLAQYYGNQYCPGPANSCALAAISVTSGHLLIIPANYFWSTGTGTLTSITDSASLIGSCFEFAGMPEYNATSTSQGDFWGCPVTGTGTDTITLHFSSANAQFINSWPLDITNAVSTYDDGMGNGAIASSGTISIPSKGGTKTSAANDLAVALVEQNGPPTISPGAGWSALNNITNTGYLLEVQTIPAAGSTFNATGSSTNTTDSWTGVAIAIK
jgi:fibronectin-binding autotransporter adhesin